MAPDSNPFADPLFADMPLTRRQVVKLTPVRRYYYRPACWWRARPFEDRVSPRAVAKPPPVLGMAPFVDPLGHHRGRQVRRTPRRPGMTDQT